MARLEIAKCTIQSGSAPPTDVIDAIQRYVDSLPFEADAQIRRELRAVRDGSVI
jgi:hypothetical protein